MIEINIINDVTHINNIFLEDVPKNKFKYYNVSNFSENITQSQLEYLQKCATTANIKLNNLPLKFHNKNVKLNNIWNFCINKPNTMFDYPYTLNDIIFLPDWVLNYKQLIEILVHERIHIIQRYNYEQWFNIISEETQWKKLEYCYLDKYIDSLVYPNVIIKNPDTYYYFSYDNCIAFFVFNVVKNKLILQWFRIEQNKNLTKIDDNLPIICENNKFNIEHPFEYYAYYYEKLL